MLKANVPNLRLDARVAIEPEFDFLSAEYRALFRQAEGAAFQGPLWLSMMHGRLAPQLGASQRTLTMRDRTTGELLAVLPVVRQRSHGVSLLQPADFGLCDSNTVVGAPDVLAALAGDRRVIDEIGEAVHGGGDLFVFRKVRRDGFDVRQLFPRAHAQQSENSDFDVAVEEDFDLWRRRVLSRHMTKELSRLGRQLEKEQGLPFLTRHTTDAREIVAGFEFLRNTRAGQFEDDLLLKPVYFEFYRDYAVAAAASDEARLYVSTLGDEPVAALFGVHADGDFHAVQLAHDSVRFGKFSLGLQVIYRTIKLRHDEGHRYFDMGLGNTGYKGHFRVEENRLDNLTLASNPLGAAVELVYTRARPVKNMLKRFTVVR